jgi:SAM-dependent methyltransferase
MNIRSLAITILPQSVRFGLRRVIYQGNERRCPLCGNGVRTFVDHGGGAEILERRQVVGGMVRHNDACPMCHSADRTRLYLLYLDEVLLADGKPKRILHVAPEFGLYLHLSRRPDVSYVATDLDGRRYRHIDEMVPADLTNLPFEDASFDAVMCSHVLEHVPDDRRAMSEIRRVLVPSGVALLMVPLATDGLGTDEDITITDPKVRDERFGQYDHLRLYGRDDFEARLEGVGFAVEWFNGFDRFPAQAKALWLNPKENLAVARPRGSNSRAV